MPRGLTETVIALCRDGLERLEPGGGRDQVEAVLERLQAPLRVVVAGRVKAGKSTLVNALLGRRVAPTDIGECTKVVTWFSYGADRVEIRHKGGVCRRLPLASGRRIPDSLGVELAAIESVRVYLSDAPESMTLIDTPGLASLNEQHSDRTEGLLGMHRASAAAMTEADALVFLMPEPPREDDAAALAAFRSLFAGGEASPATAVGVLSRADQIGGGGPDALEVAKTMADRYARALSAVAATVVPVCGLLAETAESEALREGDASSLRTLAGLDGETRRRMLLSPERFIAFESAVPPDQRRRLCALLDMFGIAQCLALIESGTEDATALDAELTTISGIGALRTLLEETFTARADVLKANAGLTALEKISWQQGNGKDMSVLRTLRNAAEEVRLEPEMRSVHELWAVQRAASEESRLPQNLREDLVRLADGRSAREKLGLPRDSAVADLQTVAAEGAARWRRYTNGGIANRTDAAIGRVAYRSYETLFAEAASPVLSP